MLVEIRGWFYHLKRRTVHNLLAYRYRTTYFTGGLVLPLDGGAGVHQQLHQPVHLCRQVPRVPEWRQTTDIETETESTAVRLARRCGKQLNRQRLFWGFPRNP